MIHRLQQAMVEGRLGRFPAVAIVGPRQAGKTTLAKEIGGEYFDLEQESERVRLDLRWDELVGGGRLVVLDEAQSWPEVFVRLRGAIDARRRVNGRFLLLGSVAPSLMTQVGESLAGRLAVVELPPLALAELPDEYADRLWRYGGFPDGGVLADDPSSGVYPVWQESYLRQMASRDLPSWGLPAKPQLTERLLKLLAAVHGTMVNASQLGQALGISYHTVQSYLDHLEGAFLIRRLKPFFANNFPKRLTKTPKVYWRDSGLLHYLLGLAGDGDLTAQPWVGASWEGWVIEQILATRQGSGEVFDAFFFRTGDGLECDLLIESGGRREIVEIKLAGAPTGGDFAKLGKIAAMVGAERQVIISRVRDDEAVASGSRWSVNLAGYLARFAARPQLVGVPTRRGGVTVDMLFGKMREAAGVMVERGAISRETLLQRAEWLKDDLATIGLEEFRILPTRWIEHPGSGLGLPLVEYTFGRTDHDINRAADPHRVEKNVAGMVGSGLDRESVLYLGQVAEIGHRLLPGMWPGQSGLRERLRLPTQHLDTLNEVWWLARWQGIDPGSVRREVIARDDAENLAKPKPSTIDWQFTVLGGQVTIRLEVKNRRGSKGAKVFDRGVSLFGDRPQDAFAPSAEDEINVLAITAYHAGQVSPADERRLVGGFLDQLDPPVIDAVAVCVKGGVGSREALYFPANRDLAKKDLILRAVFKPMDIEDHSAVGELWFPMALPNALDRAT